MTDGEKAHYENLRSSFNKIIKLVLGDNYYTIASDVYSSDIEAFEDIKDKIKALKNDLVIYKRLFYCMTIITLIISIYSIIK